jgi:hypothetical protein|tara:strand:- start:306 stop:527 length:222 start_codon:yes stop_codon:yes gene_type:complete
MLKTKGLKNGTLYYVNAIGNVARLVSTYELTESNGDKITACTVKHHKEVHEDIPVSDLEVANSYFVKKYFARS